eukprot:549642_1
MIILILYSLVSVGSAVICNNFAVDCETYECLPPVPPNEGCRDPFTTTCYCQNAGNGQSWGDCVCDGGAFTELRFKFTGPSGSDITIWNTDRPTVPGAAICAFTNVQTNEELTCNAPSSTVATEFPKNTYFSISRSGAVACDGTWHTSCSADIIGQFGQPVKEGLNEECQEIICSGWKDSGTPDNDCDDGYDTCPCNDEPTTNPNPTTEPNPTAEPNETCYCQNEGQGQQWGDCVCDGRFVELRWKFEGEGPSTITIWNKDRPGIPDNNPVYLCKYNNVYRGQELTCNVAGTGATEFPKNTYFNIERNGLTVCDGTWHTSCSANIIDQPGSPVKEGLNVQCMELICTGWRDSGNPDNDCDDGYDTC